LPSVSALAGFAASEAKTIHLRPPWTEDLGIKLESFKMKDLGQAKKVTIDKDNTTIIERAGNSAAIEGRV
jgi:chaperonin GroEL (HSP60 family)